MNSVERVKAICAERKIPISRLERNLGYANGYIGQLRKGVLPDDRLSEIAKYLEVSTDYLMTGEKTEKPAAQSDELDKQLSGIDFALYGEVKDLTDDQKRDIIQFAKFIKQKKD